MLESSCRAPRSSCISVPRLPRRWSCFLGVSVSIAFVCTSSVPCKSCREFNNISIWLSSLGNFLVGTGPSTTVWWAAIASAASLRCGLAGGVFLLKECENLVSAFIREPRLGYESMSNAAPLRGDVIVLLVRPLDIFSMFSVLRISPLEPLLLTLRGLNFLLLLSIFGVKMTPSDPRLPSRSGLTSLSNLSGFGESGTVDLVSQASAISRCEDHLVIAKGLLGALTWLARTPRRTSPLDPRLPILGDGFPSLLVCMLNSTSPLDPRLPILGERFPLVKPWLAFTSRAWMTLGFNLRWLAGESGVTGRSLLTRVDSSSLVGDRGASFAPFSAFLLLKLGEVGFDETLSKLISVEIARCWGEDDVLPGTSSCKALYKSRISLTDADTRRLSNMAAARLGSIPDGSAICFPPWGTVGDGISVKMREKNKKWFFILVVFL